VHGQAAALHYEHHVRARGEGRRPPLRHAILVFRPKRLSTVHDRIIVRLPAIANNLTTANGILLYSEVACRALCASQLQECLHA